MSLKSTTRKNGDGMDVNLVGFLIFLLVLAALIWMKREKIDVRGVMVLYKTKRFMKAIDKIASSGIRLWKVIGTLAVTVCIFFMVYGSFLLFETAFEAASGKLKEGGVKLVLPAPVSQTKTGYAYILLPFWMWLLAIFFIILPHELFHGIIARTERIPLKSVGLLLFLIFPGAFVEIDEKRLERKKLFQKLRVFAAGSFANFLVALIVFFLGTALWNFCVPGVVIEKILPGSPAEKAGIGEGEILKSINGIPVKTSFSLFSGFPFEGSPEKLTASFSILKVLTNGTFRKYSFHPGERVFVETDKGNYTLVLAEHPEMKNAPFLGISVNLSSWCIPIFRFFSLLFFLSIAIGIINILPIYPLDGGQMINAFLKEKLGKRRGERITRSITLFFVFLLIYTLFAPALT